MAGTQMTDIYLMIATAGRAELLARTLSSVADCRKPANFSGVVVVENGPACGSELICQQDYGDLPVQYLWSATPNKSHALNFALEAIPDDSLIIFSDDDIRFSPKTLVAYQQAAQLAPQDTFFGGPLGCDYETKPYAWVLPYLPLSATGWYPDPVAFDTKSDRFMGCNWAAFSRDVKRLGGFDPNYGPGSPTGATGQEANMQRRMYAAGMRSQLLSDALVYHYVPTDRCSIDWAVNRARRNGICRGIDRRERAVAEIAISHWGNTVRLLTSTATKWLTSPLPESWLHFHARYRQQKALGYFTGFRTEPSQPIRRAA